ncbi:Uncharacterised protein [uncultured archaeon]|nr:Uncharacterised protein [uncultured archaeon]
MTYKTFQKQRIRNAYSDLRRDSALSASYCTGKLAVIVGGIWSGFSALYDLAEGNYGSAFVKGLITFGTSKGYQFLDNKMVEVSRRIGRNRLVLDQKLAEDYGSQSDNPFEDFVE